MRRNGSHSVGFDNRPITEPFAGHSVIASENAARLFSGPRLLGKPYAENQRAPLFPTMFSMDATGGQTFSAIHAMFLIGLSRRYRDSTRLHEFSRFTCLYYRAIV
jgi:hypothetical protein